jgi:hypothetical protein
MKTFLHLVWIAPLALAAVACGDDSGVGGGSGGGTTSADASSGSTGPGATTSTTTTTTSSSSSPTSTSSGDGGSPGEGGAGGTTGAGGEPGVGGFVAGEPIDAPDEEWTFVEFPESRCLNDSPTGIGVNLSASNEEDIVIFLQGGNACFNQLSCFTTAHPNGFDQGDFDTEIAQVGALDLFTRGDQNPIGDWSWAYVPYCTGDVHAGFNQTEVGGQMRTFRGYRNMTDYLERLVPTFPNARRVLLTGVSAGGFGAAYNYDQVKRAFGDGVDVYLLDDSGPPMSEEFIAPCLQAHFKETWGLNATLPDECDACRAGDTFTEEFLAHEFATFPDQRFALISSTEDETIRRFWGFGNDDCAGLDELSVPTYPGPQYTEGLEDIRDRIAEGANFALFMPEGGRHVWINDTAGLSTTVDGSPELLDWIDQLINDDEAWQSWPE